MPLTVRELRVALHDELGDRAWSIAGDLADDDPLPTYALGADLSAERPAASVGPVDMDVVLASPVASPVLRARREEAREMRVRTGQLTPPAVIDWRDRWGGRWLSTIQNQNPCESCWAFGATGLVETMVRIEHGVWAKRSEGDLRDGWGGPLGENWIVRDGVAPCAHGAGVSGALDWIVNNGLADPDCFPWSPMDVAYMPTADRAGRAVRVEKYEPLGSMADQKRWLDVVGPIVASFDAYTDLGGFGGGNVYKKASVATLRGGHTVLLVGYDDNQKAWILRNSWGPGWGDSGYALFGYGECKIDDFTKYGLRGTNPDPWTRRRLHNGCVIESGNGEMHRNFELLRSSAPRARHLWRQGGENGDFSWHEAFPLENPNDPGAGAAVIGMPTLTSTTYNRNFETLYWEGSGWLRHWWFDQANRHWNDAGRVATDQAAGFPGFLQSSYGAPGNFEVTVRQRDGQLHHWWREGPPSFAWHDGGSITGRVRMSGPSLVQANVGSPGNLYVVAVMDTGQLQLWWRDDVGGTGWHRGEVFGDGSGRHRR